MSSSRPSGEKPADASVSSLGRSLDEDHRLLTEAYRLEDYLTDEERSERIEVSDEAWTQDTPLVERICLPASHRAGLTGALADRVIGKLHLACRDMVSGALAHQDGINASLREGITDLASGLPGIEQGLDELGVRLERSRAAFEERRREVRTALGLVAAPRTGPEDAPGGRRFPRGSDPSPEGAGNAGENRDSR